jgi:hypothetical protein
MSIRMRSTIWGLPLPAALLVCVGVLAAPAAAAQPSASSAQPTANAACAHFDSTRTSCATGRSVLEHCRANGSPCRDHGAVWRCERTASGAKRCASGRRIVTSVPAPAPAPPPFSPVYLDMLPRIGGEEVTPGLVAIGGHQYPHGIQMSVGWAMEREEAEYAIPAGAQTFTAVIGNDDNQTNEFWDQIPLLYEVFVDGRRDAVAHAQGASAEALAAVPVAGGHALKLVVINAGDALGGTLADWGEPVFT